MPLTPEQAVAVVRDLLVPFYVNEHPLTKGVIASIPEQKADYKPDDVSRSAIDLAWHIVSAECRFLNAVIAGAFDFSGSARPEAMKTPMDVSAVVFERVRGGDRAAQDADGRRSW